MKTRLEHARAYVTKDRSEIRELMHPAQHGNRNQSFAEATVDAGATTVLHRHDVTEEIYHVTHGRGTMRLGSASFDIAAGDTICIPPGTPHCVANTGTGPLRILCACSPAYSHDDTYVITDTR